MCGIAGIFHYADPEKEVALQSLPHLTLAQLHAALAYYFDHQQEIDLDLARNNDANYWKKQARKLATQPV